MPKKIDEIVQEESSEEEQKELSPEQEELRSKVYQFVGSAQSFEEVEVLAEVTKMTDDILDLTYMLDSIAWNISRSESDSGDPKAKGGRILTEAKALVIKIEELISEASEDLVDDTDTDDANTSAADSVPIDDTTVATNEINTAVDEEAKSFMSKVRGALQSFGLWKPTIKTIKESTSFKLFKSDGSYFLYGRPTNNILDREDDILTDAAHKEFAAFLDENPDQMPVLQTWHTEGTERESKASWHSYSDGFFHFIWPLTEEEAKGIEDFCEVFDPGMSHGFYPLGIAPGIKVLEKEGNLITKYRTEEASILPIEYAANSHTTFQLVTN